jgi:hypothetical protein
MECTVRCTTSQAIATKNVHFHGGAAKKAKNFRALR